MLWFIGAAYSTRPTVATSSPSNWGCLRQNATLSNSAKRRMTDASGTPPLKFRYCYFSNLDWTRACSVPLDGPIKLCHGIVSTSFSRLSENSSLSHSPSPRDPFHFVRICRLPRGYCAPNQLLWFQWGRQLGHCSSVTTCQWFEITPSLNPLPPSDAVRKQKKKYFTGSSRLSIVTI